jgi:hypothetical protein
VFKFELNGVTISDQPDGWESINTSIKRDSLSGGLYFDSDINLTCYGGQDLFIALRGLWQSDPFGRSTFKIYQKSTNSGYMLIHSGIIFHSDMKLAMVNNAIQFKVEDDNWYSKIKSNQSIEVSIGTTLSKNQVAIAPAPSFNLSVHKVTNGTYYANTRKAYRIYDCLKYLIDFMSDGEVGFESDCFNTGGVFADYCLVIGHELLYFDGTKFPRLSFSSLFNDLKKKFNIRFAVVYTGALPKIKIEPSDYFFDSTVSFTIPTIPDEVTINADSSLMYSRCRIGSEEYDTTSSLIFPDVSSLISFRDETLHFEGVNNIDNELDLVVKFVTSNAIIDICLELYSGHDSYEDNNFIIWYNSSTNQTHSTDWPGTGHHLYNEPLNNINTLQRWSGYIPGNAISSFNNSVQSRFLAINTTENPYSGRSNGTFGPLQFNDDYSLGYDPTNAYGGGTSQGSIVSPILSIYTAQSPGNYTVSTYNAFVTLGQAKLALIFKKFNASNVEIDSLIGPYSNFLQFRNVNLSLSWNTYLNAGEYIAVYFSISQLSSTDWLIYPRSNISYFTSNGLNNGNGVVLATNNKNYKCYKVNYKYPIKLADFKTIGQSKNGLIIIPLQNNRSIRAWVENVKFDNSSGDTTFTLISDGNTIYR